MLRFFRHIRQNLLQQGKVSRYLGYAIGEIVLIVVGILIALELSEWKAARADLLTEREHLVSLRKDFEETQTIIQTNLTASVEQLRHIKTFLQLLEGEPGSVPVERLVGMVRKSFLGGPIKPILGTYNDLVNSGDIGLLRSEELRLLLAKFEPSWEQQRVTTEMMSEQWSNLVMPFYMENLNVTAMYGLGSAIQFEDNEKELPGVDLGPPVTRIEPEESAFWSREFMNLLAIRALSLGDTIWFLEPALKRVKEILELIDDSLEQA